MSDYEDLLFEIEDGIATITINRPDNGNMLRKQTTLELADALRRLREDPALTVGILTGAGDRFFCIGGEHEEVEGYDYAAVLPVVDVYELLDTISKPVIAAVNGYAYAGGFLLAQQADLCIAADHAKFAITEARVGRGSPWAAPLAWLIPPRVAMELLMTAEPISAQRAYELGLVNKVVPQAALAVEAQRLAMTIADNAPLSVRAAKALVYASAEMGWSAALDTGDRIYERVYLSEDGQEGPRAFKEKRKPEWKGR